MKTLIAIISVSLSTTAFAQVTRSTAPVPTPRSQPIGPVGPGTANNPPVVSTPTTSPFTPAPSQGGSTFGRSLIGGPPPSATQFSPDASVPTSVNPSPGTTPITPQGLLGSRPVTVTNFGLSGVFSSNVINGAGGVSASPVQVPNMTTRSGSLFTPINPAPATVFNFPPGSTIITNGVGRTAPAPLPPVTPIAPLNPSALGSPAGNQTGSATSSGVQVPPSSVTPSTPLSPVVVPPSSTTITPPTTTRR